MPVRGPAIPPLRRQLELSRSLRPLRRRVPSQTSFVVDEAATAAYAAEEGIWLPVLRPAPSRWLDLILVVDTSPSMIIWRQTITEFQMVMERLGAFRTVRVAAIDGTTGSTEPLTFCTGTITGGRAGHDSKRTTSLESVGRQAILVVTDTVSGAWQDGRMDALLRHWATSMPTAVAVVIPQRMWSGTGLRTVAAELRALTPGAANGLLRTRGTSTDVTGTVPVPVMELSARWLGPWADVVAGAPGWRKLALLAAPTGGLAALRRMPATGSAAEVVRRFRSAASPTAFRLACYLSAACLNLPVMRLVQRVMLPESDNAHLAEVFLGGLLRSIPNGAQSNGAEIIEYDFLPGVRNELNSYLLRDEMLVVLSEVSQFMAERFGQRLDFAALVSDPEGTPLSALISDDGQPLAYIAATTLAKLGGRYRVLADRMIGAGPAAAGSATFASPTTTALGSPTTPLEERPADSPGTAENGPGAQPLTTELPQEEIGNVALLVEASVDDWRAGQQDVAYQSAARLLESSGDEGMLLSAAARGRATQLFERLATLSDDGAERLRIRGELVELHLPLVGYLARRFSNRGEWLDDLTQVATIGLIKAIDRFDLAFGLEFSTYATPIIAAEINRHLQDQGWAVRVPPRLQELRLALIKAIGDLAEREGRAPTVAEIAAHLQMSENEVLEGLEAANAYSTISLNAPETDDEDAPAVIESLGMLDEALEGLEYRESLKPLLAQLPSREKRILLLRFFGNMTQDEIARELGMSQAQVSRTLTRTLRVLRFGLITDE